MDLLITMKEMTTPKFKDYLFEKFLEWEKTTPKKRSSVSAYARWLSENTYEVEVKQQVIDTWINGSLPKDEKYIDVLAEKLGDEIYEILNRSRPNPRLKRVTKIWEFLPESVQVFIEEEAAKYETQNITDTVQKVPKRKKAPKRK